MNSPLSSQPLWDFALAFYAQPRIADVCLHLQDEYCANVCLLIAMHWLDARKQSFNDIGLASLKTHIAGWTTQVVEPLRFLRKQLKLPFETLQQDETQQQLRNMLKQAELLAEKKLLMEIEKWVSENLQDTDKPIATTNVERYIKELNVPRELAAVFL